MAMLPLTQKANEALVGARDKAVAGQHPELLPQHLFAALLEPDMGLRPVLERAGLAAEALDGLVDGCRPDCWTTCPRPSAAASRRRARPSGTSWNWPATPGGAWGTASWPPTPCSWPSPTPPPTPRSSWRSSAWTGRSWRRPSGKRARAPGWRTSAPRRSSPPWRSTPGTSPRWPGPASWTRSSAGTRRSAG